MAHREKIRQAIDVWHSQTQIKLVPRTNHKDYVEFIAGDGNSSYVGKIGGKQNITIDSSLGTAGNMIHEIGHAVGMLHEHQNFLRDDHIIVHENNIQNAYRSQFTKMSGNQHVSYNSMYGIGAPFSSIMMYPSFNSFAISPAQPTMTVKTGLIFPINPYVDQTTKTFSSQRKFLTASDRAAVAWVYGYTYDPATDDTLTEEIIGGFPPLF